MCVCEKREWGASVLVSEWSREERAGGAGIESGKSKLNGHGHVSTLQMRSINHVLTKNCRCEREPREQQHEQNRVAT